MFEDDDLIHVFDEWRLKKQPQLPSWPRGYGLLESVRINREQSLGFSFSLSDGQFAMVPFTPAAADCAPIFIEDRYDNETLKRALHKFAFGEYEHLSLDPRLRRYKTESGFNILSVAQVTLQMVLGFAYSWERDTYAILRYEEEPQGRKALPPIIIERKYDTAALAKAIVRFANGEYPEVEAIIEAYDSAAAEYNEWLRDQRMPRGGPGLFNRGYSAERPDVRLPKQSDFD